MVFIKESINNENDRHGDERACSRKEHIFLRVPDIPLASQESKAGGGIHLHSRRPLNDFVKCREGENDIKGK